MSSVEFKNQAAEFVALTHYAKWKPEANRRETWSETGDRWIGYLKSKAHLTDVPDRVWAKVRKFWDTFGAMPSMRLVATAGAAMDKDNGCGYNCSYLPIDSAKSFGELLYILMLGTGVGFSVEKENISKLPVVKHQTAVVRDDYVIGDNRESWAKAFLFGVETWLAGESVHFDYSLIRPYGAPLKTMGGRASGPEPLRTLMEETKKIIRAATGRQLSSLECHDICCLIAENVISGGKRRSALASLSDLDDVEMRNAKSGEYPLHRCMSNNSAVYKCKPTSAEFIREWAALAESGTGERGLYRDTERGGIKMRPNPCFEIRLRPLQMCNLSEVVVRAEDDLSDLVDKVKTATWLGCIQATFTNFPFIRGEWAKNCEEERLIGVSITGQMDNPKILTPVVLKELKKVCQKTAKEASKVLGINTPAELTCVKPSGTVSQVVDSSSGCHPRYSQYYIRRYRISKSDPMFEMLKDQGVPWKPESGQTADNYTTAVFEFPIKAPTGCVTRKDMDAIAQIDWYLKLQECWCTQNASITVYVKDNEWLKVGNYVYENWDKINGIAFLPYDGHKYELAPYEEITKEQYENLGGLFPRIDFSKLGEYENKTGDTTTGSREFSCVGDRCELK